MRTMLAVPALGLPRRQAGAALPGDAAEPVFAVPWQAHAFAIVMALQGEGHTTWAKWDDHLGPAPGDTVAGRGRPGLQIHMGRHTANRRGRRSSP